MTSVSVFNLQAVADRIRAVGGTPDKALAGAAEDVEEAFAQAAGKHNKTGALVASVTKGRTKGGWEVFHDLQRAPYAGFVHWGTRPHEIRPKVRDGGGGKHALRWPAGGRWVFAKVVHHPGNAPDMWVLDAARMAPFAFERHVAAQIARITKG